MYHDKLQGLTEEGVGVVWYNKATVRISFGGKSWYHQQLIQCFICNAYERKLSLDAVT